MPPRGYACTCHISELWLAVCVHAQGTVSGKMTGATYNIALDQDATAASKKGASESLIGRIKADRKAMVCLPRHPLALSWNGCPAP